MRTFIGALDGSWDQEKLVRLLGECGWGETREEQ